MALKGCQKLIKVEILGIFHSGNFWEKYSYPVPIYVSTLDPEVLSQTIPQISTWLPTQNLCDSDFFFSFPQIFKLSHQTNHETRKLRKFGGDTLTFVE